MLYVKNPCEELSIMLYVKNPCFEFSKNIFNPYLKTFSYFAHGNHTSWKLTTLHILGLKFHHGNEKKKKKKLLSDTNISIFMG